MHPIFLAGTLSRTPTSLIGWGEKIPLLFSTPFDAIYSSTLGKFSTGIHEYVVRTLLSVTGGNAALDKA